LTFPGPRPRPSPYPTAPSTGQENPRDFEFRPITDLDNDAPEDIDITSFKDAPPTDPLNKAPSYLEAPKFDFIRERKDTSGRWFP
jgi:hypothetical protein